MAQIYPFNKKTIENIKNFFEKISPALFFLIPALAVIAIILAVSGAFQILGSNYNSNKEDQQTNESNIADLKSIYIGNERIELKVEIADSGSEWEKGLMNRTYLPQDQGMLFVFPDETVRIFWMKNTYIPLDIIYINSNNEITNFYESVEPLNDIKTYTSEGGAKYALEANGGFVKEKKIQKGMKVYFSWSE